MDILYRLSSTFYWGMLLAGIAGVNIEYQISLVTPVVTTIVTIWIPRLIFNAIPTALSWVRLFLSSSVLACVESGAIPTLLWLWEIVATSALTTFLRLTSICLLSAAHPLLLKPFSRFFQRWLNIVEMYVDSKSKSLMAGLFQIHVPANADFDEFAPVLPRWLTNTIIYATQMAIDFAVVLLIRLPGPYEYLQAVTTPFLFLPDFECTILTACSMYMGVFGCYERAQRARQQDDPDIPEAERLEALAMNGRGLTVCLLYYTAYQIGFVPLTDLHTMRMADQECARTSYPGARLEASIQWYAHGMLSAVLMMNIQWLVRILCREGTKMLCYYSEPFEFDMRPLIGEEPLPTRHVEDFAMMEHDLAFDDKFHYVTVTNLLYGTYGPIPLEMI
ncbi:uncharacterized protein BCR38DRAFT_506908 [Pseudomassariella vexata]|uniref:Uncharacterized protein n=1 Tax=Pseudomassariella vexata TaxID=1141098 RepID=A0A1Y2EAA4_9PEZI|nr:uncharacterized protein BCR38DRAFT_506908 [Pseudomassariella vexata]ORY68327.1 hypothetical protein BCR38DRAFT_506908 [Pseudomassariella vexata]